MAETAPASSEGRSLREPAETAQVAEDAYALGPRALAILRGREICAEDLRLAHGAYSLQDVEKLLQVSRQSISRMVLKGDLLSVPGPHNERRYPAMQFTSHGRPMPGLRRVMAALPTRNPWAILNFLVRPADRLSGRPPIELLSRGQLDAVIEAASHLAEPGA